MRKLTLKKAKNLTHGTILYHMKYKNADETPQRWRVISKVKRWKRNPDRIRIGLANGLYNYDTLTENEIHLFSLTEK